jgi:hypothetical protein
MIPKESRGKIFTYFFGIFLCLHVRRMQHYSVHPSSLAFSQSPPQASSHYYSLCSITCMALCCSAPRRICITSIHPCTSYPKFQPQAFVFLSSLPEYPHIPALPGSLYYCPYIPPAVTTIHPSLRIFPSPHSPRISLPPSSYPAIIIIIHPLPIHPSIHPPRPPFLLPT